MKPRKNSTKKQDSTIGERIKERRLSLGLTQEDLALKMGYKSKSTINKIESGVNDIPQKQISAFAIALDTTVPYLMGFERTNQECDYTISDTTQDISKRILYAICKSQLTYRELEDLTGIPSSNLQRYANCKTSKISVDVLIAIAKATNISFAYLMGCSNEPKSDFSENQIKLIELARTVPDSKALLAYKIIKTILEGQE